MEESLQISLDEESTLKKRLEVKLMLFLAAAAMLLIKINYYYHCHRMEKKIEEFNMQNRLQISKPTLRNE